MPQGVYKDNGNYIRSSLSRRSFRICALISAIKSYSWVENGEKFTEKLAGQSSINAPLHGCIASLNHTHEGYIISELNLSILDDSDQTYSIKKGAPIHEYS